jgi:hypothetical protein
MSKAAKQITNEEYASRADFMRGVSALDQLRTDPTTALSGGATGAEREALLAHVRQSQVRATAMLDEKRVQLKKLMMAVELLRDDDTEHYEERLALVHDVLLGAPTTVAQVVRHFGAASSSRLLQIEAMVAKLFRAQGFPPPAICFQRDIPTILIAMQFSVRPDVPDAKEPAGCAETEGVQACSEEADHVKALLRELCWGGAYVQPMLTFEDGVRAIGGTEDRMLCRESALLKQALGSLGGCELQWEQSKHELEVMLRGAQGASALRRLCVGDELSAEASADICGVVRPLKARLVGFFKAMRAGGPQLPTCECFNLYDLSDNIYARDACLLCAALTDRIDDECDVDRFCELVRRISATTALL